MTDVSLSALDLAALLCSRVCHDVISPVGAIVNGLEVLEEEKDESMRAFAEDLIRKSAKQASARLQFARLAFGAAGSAGAAIDLGDAAQIAKGFIEDDRIKLSMDAPRVLLPKNQVKMFLNLLMIAATAIPRGGQITAVAKVDGDKGYFTITSTGTSARIPPHVEGLLAHNRDGISIDAHAIQPYYTGLIASEAGFAVAFSIDGETVNIIAAPKA
ncbi:MAG: histidine phosphotransferase family protein [Alphaproteobacteria bacterium]